MEEACGASDMESRAGEALGLVLRADGDRVWAPLVLAMVEIERLVFHKVRGGVTNGPIQTNDFWVSFEGDPLKFLGFTTWRAFLQVEVAMRNEK